jgi:hypothetical protein
VRKKMNKEEENLNEIIVKKKSRKREGKLVRPL